MFNFFGNRDMGIDLGTANTLVHVKGRGIVLSEPSVVAIQRDTNEVLAVGEEAKQMIGRTPGNVIAIRPLKDGVIADFTATQLMLKNIIQKVDKRFNLGRPRVVVGVPSGITEVEERAVEESVLQAGAKEVYLIEEPMAAAIGAGIPVSDPSGYVVVDIGGGTTEIGVTSLGGLVLCKSIKVAGDKFDKSIIEHVRQNYNLFIGERTAENIKIEIGTAIKLDTELKMKVKGRDNSGLLSTIELGSEGVRIAIKEPLKEIVSAIKSVLENMPPDLASDIVDNGVIITGGGALIRGLDTYLSDIIKLPVRIADEPLLSVAYGTSQVLDEPELLKLITNA